MSEALTRAQVEKVLHDMLWPQFELTELDLLNHDAAMRHEIERLTECHTHQGKRIVNLECALARAEQERDQLNKLAQELDQLKERVKYFEGIMAEDEYGKSMPLWKLFDDREKLIDASKNLIHAMDDIRHARPDERSDAIYDCDKCYSALDELIRKIDV